MISQKHDWATALTFLEREMSAFGSLLDALKAQATALRVFSIADLESCQLTLETALALTENVVYERVKWQQEHFGQAVPPTWLGLMEHAPESIKTAKAEQVQTLRMLCDEVRTSLAQNQRYSAAAKDMLGSLKHVEQKVISEKTDLYTSRGTLSGHVAMGTTNGGAR